MTLDKVITIAIGRDNADGTLDDIDWQEFRYQLRITVDKYATVVADTLGSGVGSDDDRNGRGEDTAIILAINPSKPRSLRRELAAILKQYGQSSACFALDSSHRPAFNTKTGRRSTT